MAGSRVPRYSPVLFRDRPVHGQVLSGVVGPAAFGAGAGALLGVSAGGYWGLGAVAAVGAFLGGFEHRDGWGGADRGFFGGLIYGVVLLVVHALL